MLDTVQFGHIGESSLVPLVPIQSIGLGGSPRTSASGCRNAGHHAQLFMFYMKLLLHLQRTFEMPDVVRGERIYVLSDVARVGGGRRKLGERGKGVVYVVRQGSN